MPASTLNAFQAAHDSRFAPSRSHVRCAQIACTLASSRKDSRKRCAIRCAQSASSPAFSDIRSDASDKSVGRFAVLSSAQAYISRDRSPLVTQRPGTRNSLLMSSRDFSPARSTPRRRSLHPDDPRSPRSLWHGSQLARGGEEGIITRPGYRA